MSHDHSRIRNDQPDTAWASPSEPQIHTEHRAALDATLFRRASDPYELVLELDAGQLRVRNAPDPERD